MTVRPAERHKIKAPPIYRTAPSCFSKQRKRCLVLPNSCHVSRLTYTFNDERPLTNHGSRLYARLGAAAPFRHSGHLGSRIFPPRFEVSTRRKSDRLAQTETRCRKDSREKCFCFVDDFWRMVKCMSRLRALDETFTAARELASNI